MSVLTSLIVLILHVILVFLAAPTLAGVLGFLTDRLAGRDGQPILQPWRDLVRLMRKQPVLAENASAVVRVAPLLTFTLAGVCAALVPSFSLGMAFTPMADLLTIAALLALVRMVLILAVMDAGTGEGGVVATQATSLAMTAEPALLLVIVALSVLAGTGNLDLIIDARRDGIFPAGPAAELAVAALAVLAWAETEAVPIDQAFSARDLALVTAAGHLRRLVWFSLVGVLTFPAGIAAANAGPIAWLVGLAAWCSRLLLAALVLAGVRLLVGCLPPRGLPAILGLTALLCLLAVALSLVNAGPI
jgi:formate hydrogenlyase subunit 4